VTTTIVLGRTDDGYLVSSGATFNDARFGTADSVGVGNLSYWGQRKFAGTVFEVREAAIGFTFPAVAATELVCSAVVQLQHSAQNSPSRGRNVILKPQNWVPGGLTTADFMTASQLQAADTWSTILNAQAVGAKITYGGGDRLVAHLEAGSTSATFLVVDRTTQDGAPVPTGDELGTFWSGNSSGTANDPRLVYTSVPRHRLVPVLGASVMLSDGTHASLQSTAVAGQVVLRHADGMSVSSVPLPADFATNVPGAQGFSLAVDDQDNVYVVGRSAVAPNSVAVKAYLKNSGSVGFNTAMPVKVAALPGFASALNNFAAAWHSTAGGTLMVVAAHTAGDALPGAGGSDIAYALFSSTALYGAGNATRGVGSAIGLFTPARVPSSTAYNSHGNETGTGLDVAVDPTQPDWGYVLSFNKGTLLGQNNAHYIGRYILNATGDGFYHVSVESSEGWGVKDANAKVRVVPVGAAQVAAVTADDDAGFGLSVNIWQAIGTLPGFVQLGQVLMDQESILDFPTPADFAMSSAWDVVYSSLDNKLWIYFVRAGTTGQVQRTSIDLNTYQATGVVEEVEDYSATDSVVSLRAPRGQWAITHSFLDVALKATAGGAFTLDTVRSGFNVAPLAPTLVPRGNYDATMAADFAWTFRDTPGDSQSAYQLQVEDVADGSVDLDTGKTASAVSLRNVAGGTLANTKSYRWRVRTWDALDVEGPWSDYGTFSTSAGGTVTVTDPAMDNTGGVVTDDYVIHWSVTGTVQASYRVILVRTDTGATISDTGWIASLDTQLLVGGMASDVEHRVDVQVRNAGLVGSGIGSRLITPSYAVPEVPLIQATPFPEDGYVLVTVDNPIPGQPANNAPEFDFETDALGATPASWAAADGTFVASNTVAHKGSQSARLTSVGSPASAYARAASFGVVPGTRYACRMWAYVPVSVKVQASIDWRLAGGTYHSSANGPEVMVPASTWTLLSITAEAPGGVAEAGYGPTLPANPVTGSIVYVDEVALPEASDRPDVSRNLVLRRPVGSTDPWDVVGECDPDGSVRDYTCPAWVPVEYMVRGEV
jgi:hypothetical protein